MEQIEFLDKNLSELTPEDLEEVEPDRTDVQYACDFEIYEVDDEVSVILRDNPECVWVEDEDENVYCAESHEAIKEARSKLGQNNMGDVTTGMRPGCLYHEPDGPSAFTGSYDHEDVWG